MSVLRKRVSLLLKPSNPNQGPAAWRSVQDAIVEVAELLNRPGWSSYLVGGTLRDLLVEPEVKHRRPPPRDIDLVVSGPSYQQLLKTFQGKLVLERRTRFGGLHLIKKLPVGQSIVFDVWALADTWGFGSRKILPRIQDFPGTTFMNIDSCAIELCTVPGRKRALFSDGFFEGIASKVLDVNYAPNPYPYVCVARAMILAARLRFAMTRSLVEFILKHTSAGGIQALIEAQESHYGMVRCDAKELEAWIQNIRAQYSRGQRLIRLAVPRARRLQLWSDYPT
jgi:hypothetical protein